MHNHNYINKKHLPGVDSAGNHPGPRDPTCLMLIQDTNIRLKMQFEFVYSPIFILFAILWLIPTCMNQKLSPDFNFCNFFKISLAVFFQMIFLTYNKKKKFYEDRVFLTRNPQS